MTVGRSVGRPIVCHAPRWAPNVHRRRVTLTSRKAPERLVVGGPRYRMLTVCRQAVMMTWRRRPRRHDGRVDMDMDLVAIMELLRGDCYAPTNGYDGLGTAGGPEDRAAAWHAVAELLALRLDRCQGNYIELWDGCYSDNPPEHDAAPEPDAVANVVLEAIRG